MTADVLEDRVTMTCVLALTLTIPGVPNFKRLTEATSNFTQQISYNNDINPRRAALIINATGVDTTDFQTRNTPTATLSTTNHSDQAAPYMDVQTRDDLTAALSTTNNSDKATPNGG